MIDVCMSDSEMGAYSLDCFQYPTKKFRLPFQAGMSSLQVLAKGLRTELEAHHQQRSEIVLVGHSLGGLIARQYVLDEIKSNRTPLSSKLILFATPNIGASVAKVSYLSWDNRHFRQLNYNSDALNYLNDDWVRQSVESKVSVLYVMGGADLVVRPDSAHPNIGTGQLATLVGYNHRNIVSPASALDSRYVVMKKFALGAAATKISDEVALQNKPADPLFDIYTINDEEFYMRRAMDMTIGALIPTHHVWIAGKSGVGKTTAVRRTTLSSARHLIHISLGSYEKPLPADLFRAICSELLEIGGGENQAPASDATEADLILFFRRAAKKLVAESEVTVLIEEIPLSANDLIDFLNIMSRLTASLDSDGAINGKIKLAFSSIDDPAMNLGAGAAKLRERVQFLNLDSWAIVELRGLIELITASTNRKLSDAEIEMIASSAGGSPRYVKAVFRKLRNASAQHVSLERVLETVRMEQI